VADVLERDEAPVGPFFVSDGESHSMERVADLVERLAGAPPAVRLPLSQGLLGLAGTAAERLARATGIGALAARSLGELRASGWACVPDEARAALGFAPRHHLDDGLPEVFGWYRSHGWI
jgi:nucleoside-diphosphate-sugar epimerase